MSCASQSMLRFYLFQEYAVSIKINNDRHCNTFKVSQGLINQCLKSALLVRALFAIQPLDTLLSFLPIAGKNRWESYYGKWGEIALDIGMQIYVVWKIPI